MYGDDVAAHGVETPARSVLRFGHRMAMASSVLTLFTFVVAILTPPLSGPWCAGGCFVYPYTDVASRFPRDYWWMFAALVQLPVVYALFVALHHFVPRDRRVYSHVAMGFALFGTATLIVDYAVQLIVVQPSLLAGESDGISLLTQFNAHGLFIALEEVGYVMIALAMLALAPVFDGKTRVERALRWLCLATFTLVVVSFIWIAVEYGFQREYRFEIAVISIDWLALIPFGVLVAALFRRAQRASRAPGGS